MIKRTVGVDSACDTDVAALFSARFKESNQCFLMGNSSNSSSRITNQIYRFPVVAVQLSSTTFKDIMKMTQTKYSDNLAIDIDNLFGGADRNNFMCSLLWYHHTKLLYEKGIDFVGIDSTGNYLPVHPLAFNFEDHEMDQPPPFITFLQNPTTRRIMENDNFNEMQTAVSPITRVSKLDPLPVIQGEVYSTYATHALISNDSIEILRTVLQDQIVKKLTALSVTFKNQPDVMATILSPFKNC
jgi:hypothetical protein